MNSYLTDFINLIPATQQARLLQVLKAVNTISGVSSNTADLETQLTALIAQLNKPLGSALVQFRPAGKYGKISSSDYNKTMQEMYVDLGALFKQNNSINKSIVLHRALNDAALADARATIRKVSNDVTVYQILKQNQKGVTDAVYDNFIDNDNQSVDPIYTAWLDTDTQTVRLPVGTYNNSLNINGFATAEINVKRYGGGILGVLRDEQSNLDNAIDGSTTTFWGEVVLTDQPISQIYNGSPVFGAIAEIYISMHRSEAINYLRYIPFSNYPLSVLAIKYRSSSSGAWIDTGAVSQTSTATMDFHFQEVYAKDIMIVINQQDVSVNTYALPSNVVNNALLWQQIANNALSIIETETDINQSVQDAIDYDPSFQSYVSATNQYSTALVAKGNPPNYVYDGSISETQFDAATETMLQASTTGADILKQALYGSPQNKTNNLVQVRKYQYVYGAYEIQVKKVWYLGKGEYIGPMYKPNGPVIQAYVEADYVAPSGTTVEFQVSTRPGQWRNLVADNGPEVAASGFVTRERVDVDQATQVGTLRFAASGVPTAVYMDGNIMPSGQYSYSNNNISVASGVYSPMAAYTASYQIAGFSDIMPSGRVADFEYDPIIPKIDIFTGTGASQYSVTTSYAPFVDYRIINDTSAALKTSPDFLYTNGRWQNISASGVYGILPGEYYDPMIVTVNGYPAENFTDYYNNERPALTQYNAITYPNFDYFNSENDIYFNVALQGYTVKIIYNYLNNFVQFAATLRNNLRSNVTQTPVLNDYTVKLRTI